MNLIAAILYAVAASVLLGTGLSFGGGLNPDLARLALVGGLGVGLFAWWRGRGDGHKLERPRGWEWLPVVLFALFALRAFLWLIWREGDELRVLSPNNLGDMSLHLTFIEYFKNGCPFWPDSPIYANGKLAYAAGMDFFNALLASVGVDVVAGLIWVGLAGAVLTGFALWRWGGAFTLMGFLCIGGLAGFAAFAQVDAPFFQDYPGLMKFDWAWKSLPLALLVTQRGFLFALPAGLLLLSSWRTRYFAAGDGWKLPFLGELLLYAAMPFFHVHTFIVLSFMLAAFFICNAGARWKLTLLVGAALVPATVLVWYTTGMGQANALPMWEDMSQVESPPGRPAAQVLGWQPGWMVNDPLEREKGADLWHNLSRGAANWLEPHGRFLCFWLGNFGLWPLVVGALTLALLRVVLPAPLSTLRVWLAVIWLLLITPLFGMDTGYQSQPMLDFLVRFAGFGAVALFVAILGAAYALPLAPSAQPGRLDWRPALIALNAVGILFLMGGLKAFIARHHPSVPVLPADAAPLLVATAAFVVLLVAMARRWEAAMWPAAFVFPALFLFFVCCNVKFAPSSWDNTKLMMWSVLIVMPFVWDTMMLKWSWQGRTVACTLLFFSGFVSLLGGIGSQHHGHAIASQSQMEYARAATRAIPRTEAIATAPIYNHPMLLIGRKVVMGYTAHLTSHGLDIDEQWSLLHTLMNGDDEWRFAAARLGVRYLWWGPEEVTAWPASKQPWRKAVQPVHSGPWGELFDLELPRVPIAE